MCCDETKHRAAPAPGVLCCRVARAALCSAALPSEQCCAAAKARACNALPPAGGALRHDALVPLPLQALSTATRLRRLSLRHGMVDNGPFLGMDEVLPLMLGGALWPLRALTYLDLSGNDMAAFPKGLEALGSLKVRRRLAWGAAWLALPRGVGMRCSRRSPRRPPGRAASLPGWLAGRLRPPTLPPCQSCLTRARRASLPDAGAATYHERRHQTACRRPLAELPHQAGG